MGAMSLTVEELAARLAVEARVVVRRWRHFSMSSPLSSPRLLTIRFVRGHEKVPAGGQLRSPLVATRSPRWWPAEVPGPR